MPAFPELSPHALSIRKSTFEAFAKRLRVRRGNPGFVPLHLGDVYLPPPLAARQISLDDTLLHDYGPIPGDASLREAAAADLAQFGLEVGANEVFVTAGATGGLDLALNATLGPGDEVLVLTPTWPLLFGLLQRRGCVPVEVDVDPSGWLPDDPTTLIERLKAAITDRTCGVAFCNPNNPAGFVYSDAQLQAIAELAKANDLWIYYDAVYMDLDFEKNKTLAFVQQNRDRVFAVTSFSKSFGLAGHRVGLLVSPPGAPQEQIPTLQSHSTYHAGNMGQRMALASLRADAADERAKRLDIARAGAEQVVEVLGDCVALRAPKGGAFVFLDLRARTKTAADTLAFLGACLERDVSLAPGSAFGMNFCRFARVCTTATPPDQLEEGLARIREVLGG